MVKLHFNLVGCLIERDSFLSMSRATGLIWERGEQDMDLGNYPRMPPSKFILLSNPLSLFGKSLSRFKYILYRFQRCWFQEWPYLWELVPLGLQNSKKRNCHNETYDLFENREKFPQVGNSALCKRTY